MAPKTRERRTPMSDQLSSRVRCLYQIGYVPITEMMNKRKYPELAKFSRATLFRHAVRPLDEVTHDKRHMNPGRPRKSTSRDVRRILRQVKVLREHYGSFSSINLQVACGLSETMSNLTFRRLLQKHKIKWLNTRKKGVLTKADMKLRRKWYHKAKRHNALSCEFWREGISMYIDAVGFQYKTNPYDLAKSLGRKEWRRVDEGLHYACTSKGCKEGAKQVRFMVGITYDEGVTMCVPLTKKMSGTYFAGIIDEHLSKALDNSEKRSRRILQDGCPCQNSQKARRHLDQRGIKLFKIPPRSPDLNVIENVFNQVRRLIKTSSIEGCIKSESKEEFTDRVMNILLTFDRQRINNLIDSMPRRMKYLNLLRGQRLRY